MGTRRNVVIVTQHPVVPAVPADQERMWRRVYRLDAWRDTGGRCTYCGIRVSACDITADHALPVRKGGRTTRSNIRAACFDCNQAKGTMSETMFRRRVVGPLKYDALGIHMAHFRWRIERRLQQAERRLIAFFDGVGNDR